MDIEQGIFNRTERLVGEDILQSLQSKRVIVFGVGGVGSWCVEALVRSGVRHITIVDSDKVAISNVNRQLMATTKTVGRVKVDALKEHLLDINPHADITALQMIFDETTAESFHLEEYDYIVDAIDSIRDKLLLIECACRTKAKFFSSMGAALKMDPTKIEVAEFWKVKGCPLGAALRHKFRSLKRRPARKFLCVFSQELLPNLGPDNSVDAAFAPTGTQEGNPELAHHDWNARKAQINGSLLHITGIFGFTLAGLILKDIYNKSKE